MSKKEPQKKHPSIYIKQVSPLGYALIVIDGDTEKEIGTPDVMPIIVARSQTWLLSNISKLQN